MGLADLLSRLTALLSNIGVVLVFLNLPLAMLGLATINWSAVVLLLAAPTMGTLLQLALSRAREYDADATAAALTHDPEGLAQALLRLERQQGSWVEQLLLGRRMPDPSLLRTHPPTAERIRRLQAIARDLPTGRPIAPWPTPYVPGPPTLPPPRRHLSGLWY
jgi:heat shock protein HtpX